MGLNNSMSRGCDWEKPFFTVYMNSMDAMKCYKCGNIIDDKTLYKINGERICKECWSGNK